MGPMPSIHRTVWWWNPARALFSQGVTSHVSDPPKSTACITVTQNLPAVLLYAPSPPRIFTMCPHFYHACRRLCSTSGQSLSEDKTMRPKYFNEGSDISGVQYSNETPSNRSSVSATTNLRCFISNPLQHIAEVGCAQLSAYCGTNM